MLKLVTIGTVALVASASNPDHHPISQKTIDAIKAAKTTWTPMEESENPLANASHATLNRERLGTIVRGSQAGYPEAPVANGFPTNFDSRDVWPGKIHPIRDQAQCGSCWAFGATEALSDRFAIASNGATDVVLSAQDLVSCDSDNYACQGGYLSNAWNYLLNTGAVADDSFPYTSGTGNVEQCPANLGHKYKCQAGTVQQYSSVDAIKTAVQANGPVETQFSVYGDFYNYKSGVYQHVTGGLEGGHAVKIIGWGTDEASGLDYWLIANSWGTGWGESGFFQIKQGDCGVDSNAYACQADLSSAGTFTQ
jgi:cathepsin B